jgi:hypothetical protein
VTAARSTVSAGNLCSKVSDAEMAAPTSLQPRIPCPQLAALWEPNTALRLRRCWLDLSS